MKHLVIYILAALLLTACGGHSRRAEIEARKTALRNKQDSTLAASKQRLAVVDSTLQAVNSQYEQMKAVVDRHRAELCATEEELTALTRLRMHRDSLQTEWQMLGAKIRYINSKKKE